jgi:hypothetical protein
MQNEARELSADLARLTGGQLERRAEGVALIDTTASFSDLRFPGAGTPAHVALLIAERITEVRGSRDTARPVVRRPASRDRHDVCREDLDHALPTAGRIEVFSPAHRPEDKDDATVDIQTSLIGDGEIAEWVEAIVAHHRAAIAKDYRSDPVLLADEAIGLLEKFDLVRRIPGGCVALPAIARYRVVVTTVSEPNSAAEAE